MQGELASFSFQLQRYVSLDESQEKSYEKVKIIDKTQIFSEINFHFFWG